MAGNAVVTKPAEQTPLTGYKVAKLMLEAGVPPQTLSLVLGDSKVGAALIESKNLAGVSFTGSTHVAHLINQTLAQKSGPIPRLIAETGGQNAMIVDSSALTEQVVDDVINSAFGSAGQRCSACRILYLQNDIADRTIEMLQGAMETLNIDNPSKISTDIGPLISEEARAILQHHKIRLEGFGKKIAEAPMHKDLETQGSFFAPIAYEIPDLSHLDKEIFGPALHIIRYKAADIDKVIDEINATGFGLTFGIHSRIDSFIEKVVSRIKAGNVYVNKSTIGAGDADYLAQGQRLAAHNIYGLSRLKNLLATIQRRPVAIPLLSCSTINCILNILLFCFGVVKFRLMYGIYISPCLPNQIKIIKYL